MISLVLTEQGSSQADKLTLTNTQVFSSFADLIVQAIYENVKL